MLHAVDGGPMKGEAMVVPLERLDVLARISPRASHDALRDNYLDSCRLWLHGLWWASIVDGPYACTLLDATWGSPSAQPNPPDPNRTAR